jgi:hypothetical protein
VSASLPAAPSLEQLRKQAKGLLRAHRGGDHDALYDSPPSGWAEHFGHPDAAELLRERGG